MFSDYGAFKNLWKVYLDGEPLPDVVMADVENGHAIVSDRDESGKLILAGDRVATSHKYGYIAVECLNMETGALIERWRK